MWQILVKILTLRNVQIGGARQAAVESRPMHVWKFYRLKSWSPNTYFSNKFTGSRMRPVLKDQVGWEVKWSCFKGIDSWGTSLSIKLILSLFFIMIMMLVMMMMRLMIILRNVQRKMWILCRTKNRIWHKYKSADNDGDDVNDDDDDYIEKG